MSDSRIFSRFHHRGHVRKNDFIDSMNERFAVLRPCCLLTEKTETNIPDLRTIRSYAIADDDDYV